MIEQNPVAHLRVLKPFPFVYAFYDGRVPDVRLHSETENWLDDGGFALGTASYALVDEDDALVYDTHLSPAHARKIRTFLDRLGTKRIRVVLSHHHLDHVAGNEAFADCEIIAQELTLRHLEKNRAGIEDGSYHGAPAIAPLFLPQTVFEKHLRLEGGRLDTHLAELDRLWGWNVSRILPNHGDPLVIAAGGYEKPLIRATQQYIRMLKRCVAEPELREQTLSTLIAGPLQAKWVNYFAPYEAVHRANVAEVAAAYAN